MALAKVLAGKKLLIKVSDGATPTPAFAHPCSINEARSVGLTANTNETRIPDCDDPELIAPIKREKTDYSANVAGSGVLHTSDVQFYVDWLKSPDPIATRVELSGVVLADGGGYLQADYHCTQFEISGNLGEYAKANITLLSDGDITWVDAAA